MTLIGLAMNAVLVTLLLAALVMGMRLNKRLKALRDSHDGFAVAVRELNAAAERAEKGLADLRAATDESTELLGDRIEKSQTLAQRLERLIEKGASHPAVSPHPAPPVRPVAGPFESQREADRLGALLAAAREAGTRPERPPLRDPLATPRRDARRPIPPADAELFDDGDDDTLILKPNFGARR